MSEELENVVLVKRSKGHKLARRLEKQIPGGGMPAFALLDAAGVVVASWRGYSGAREFVATLKGHIGKHAAATAANP